MKQVYLDVQQRKLNVTEETDYTSIRVHQKGQSADFGEGEIMTKLNAGLGLQISLHSDSQP